MKRDVLAIVVGYVVWTAIWLGCGALFFGDAAERMQAEVPLTELGPLLAMLGLSIACSLSGGWSAGRLSGGSSRAITILAVLLALTGLGVQLGVWDLMPSWYHVLFLALLMPMTRLGARLAVSPQ